MSHLEAANLFSVKDQVAVVTGAGSGKLTPISMSMNSNTD